jgi:hypothetical protein
MLGVILDIITTAIIAPGKLIPSIKKKKKIIIIILETLEKVTTILIKT